MLAAHAIVRTLRRPPGADIHALAERIEKPNGNGITEAEMRKLYDAGYAAGVQAAEDKHHGAADFLNADGKPTWEAVALFCPARETPPRRKKHHEFINDMAAARSGGASRPRSSTSISTVSFSSLAGKSHDARTSRRGDGSPVHRDHQRPRGAGHQRRGPDRRAAAVPDQPARREDVVPSRFKIDDVEEMVKTAIDDADAGHNVTSRRARCEPDFAAASAGPRRNGLGVRPRRRQRRRQRQGRQRHRQAEPRDRNVARQLSSLVPAQPRYPAAQAKLIGDAIRASSGADQDTGVITQCYRVAGTPNFPSAAKRARGRTTVEADHGSSSTPAGCGTR